MEYIYIVWKQQEGTADVISRVFKTESSAKNFKKQYDDIMNDVHGYNWPVTVPYLSVKSEKIYV